MIFDSFIDNLDKSLEELIDVNVIIPYASASAPISRAHAIFGLTEGLVNEFDGEGRDITKGFQLIVSSQKTSSNFRTMLNLLTVIQTEDFGYETHITELRP